MDGIQQWRRVNVLREDMYLSPGLLLPEVKDFFGGVRGLHNFHVGDTTVIKGICALQRVTIIYSVTTSVL